MTQVISAAFSLGLILGDIPISGLFRSQRMWGTSLSVKFLAPQFLNYAHHSCSVRCKAASSGTPVHREDATEHISKHFYIRTQYSMAAGRDEPRKGDEGEAPHFSVGF